MNILVLGAGAVGIGIGTTLLASGSNVSFYARGDTLEAIRANGVKRTGIFGDLDFSADEVEAASDSLDDFEKGHYDFILITLKTTANDSMSRSLGDHASLLAPGGKLVIMQNGWGNDTPYLRFFPEEQVCSARVITGFERVAPNVSNVTVHTAPILLGNLYGLDTTPLIPLAKAINDGGIPSEVTDDVGAAIWSKMLYNCALNPLGAVLGVNYGALTECPQTVEFMNDLIDEIFAVMLAAGYTTYWDTPDEYRAEFYGKLVPDTYAHNSSMLQDIRAKRKTEIDTLTGKIIELGKAGSIPVPVNTALYRLIRGMEANY